MPCRKKNAHRRWLTNSILRKPTTHTGMACLAGCICHTCAGRYTAPSSSWNLYWIRFFHVQPVFAPMPIVMAMMRFFCITQCCKRSWSLTAAPAYPNLIHINCITTLVIPCAARWSIISAKLNPVTARTRMKVAVSLQRMTAWLLSMKSLRKIWWQIATHRPYFVIPYCWMAKKLSLLMNWSRRTPKECYSAPNLVVKRYKNVLAWKLTAYALVTSSIAYCKEVFSHVWHWRCRAVMVMLAVISRLKKFWVVLAVELNWMIWMAWCWMMVY